MSISSFYIQITYIVTDYEQIVPFRSFAQLSREQMFHVPIQMEQLQILFCLVQTKSHEEFILSQLVNDEYAVSWSSLFSRVRR